MNTPQLEVFRTLRWVRGEYSFVITYAVGSERETLDAMHDMVKDPEHPFTWWDMAHMSEQFGRYVAKDLGIGKLRKAA